MAKKTTQEDFLKTLFKIYGDKYNFDKVLYVNQKSKVLVTCHIHGEFEKAPVWLIHGSACQQCSKQERRDERVKLSLSTCKDREEDFIKKSNEVHKNKYDYCKVRYVKSTAKVIIICPKHGAFEQEANSHVQGKGCKECYLESPGKNLLLSNAEVVKRLKKIHGERYGYKKINYFGVSKPITLVCQKHGEFDILASSSFEGSGCQKCSIEKRRKSSHEFLQQIIDVFGSLYDFSKVDYVNSETRVEVICKDHGSWLSYPSSLLGGHGCRHCGHESRALKATKTTYDFIHESTLIHGDKYDYQAVDYVKSDVPVEIICRNHGSFYQSPHTHLKGSGCLQCGFETTHNSSRLSRSDFIERATEVHWDKYSYEGVKFNGLQELITLLCKKHGVFSLTASSHLNGRHCAQCVLDNKNENFIAESRKKYANKFDYSKTKYSSIYEKIKLICKKHGEFTYSAAKHLYSIHGCPKCGRDSIKKSITERIGLTTESFIEKAQQVHGKRYSYDNVEYIGNKSKVLITCPKHSSFRQRPNDHLTGSGCLKCKSSRGENLVGNYLKRLNVVHQREFKISDCKNINPLPFDFAIFNLNGDLTGLIEYQGLQHRVPIDFFGGEKAFARRKKNDKIKEKYCFDNGIPLLVMWTDDGEKMKKLSSFVKGNLF